MRISLCSEYEYIYSITVLNMAPPIACSTSFSPHGGTVYAHLAIGVINDQYTFVIFSRMNPILFLRKKKKL